MVSSSTNKSSIPFTQIPNTLLNDKNISLKAKGLYSFMFSKPSGWNFTVRSMSKQLKDGVDGISSAMKELKKAGWVEYSKKQDGSGVYTLLTSSSPVIGANTEKPNQGIPNLGKAVRISNTDLYNNTNQYKSTERPSIKSKVVRLDLLERYLVMFNTIKQKEVGRKSCITSSNKKVIEAWNKYMSETNEDDLVSNKIPLIRKAIQAACRDDYHKKFKHKYITPQFFLRVDKIESWADIYESEHAKSPTTWVSKHENV